ncbi:MAG: N-acetyltransferase [Anaerolineales bacterium]
MSVRIRPETAADVPAIREVNALAFGRPAEADLVDALRAAGALACSLVAVTAAEVVGHIAFSPVTVARQPGPFFGLGPVAVRPDWQRQGIGGQLIRRGLEVLRAQGAAGVVLLGHPGYYPRFGFRPASNFGLRLLWDVTPEAFMVLCFCEIEPGTLGGLVRYHPAFDMVT